MGRTEFKSANSFSLPSSISSSSRASSAESKKSLKPCTLETELAVAAAIDQKALDVKALDVSQRCSFADHFIIVSGTSERHVKGISDKIQRRLLEHGVKPLSITGAERGEWIVLDYDDLVVHVFYEPSRQFYELDEVWKDAPTLALSAELQQEMRFLRTGSFR